MNIDRRHFLILLPAAAVAWKSVLAGTPEASPNYNMSDHWWGMLIDIPKCIGCGNCVRACADGERRARRPLPHLGRALSRHRLGIMDQTPKSSRPTAARKVSRRARKTRASISSFPRCATTARIRPARRSARWARPSSAPDGVVLVDQKYCLGCAYCVQACPYGCRYIHPEKKVADKCTLCYHRITKGLTTACCESLPHRRAATGRPEESQRSDSRVPEDPPRAGAEAADGHRRKGLLQRAGWFGAVKH